MGSALTGLNKKKVDSTNGTCIIAPHASPRNVDGEFIFRWVRQVALIVTLYVAQVSPMCVCLQPRKLWMVSQTLFVLSCLVLLCHSACTSGIVAKRESVDLRGGPPTGAVGSRPSVDLQGRKTPSV